MATAWPGTAPLALAEAIHFALIAVLGALWMSLVRKSESSQVSSAQTYGAIALAGIGLFALPIALIDLASNVIPSLTTIAIFAGVPTLTVLGTAIFGDTLAVTTSLPPSLLGWWGALLLFPVALPTTLRQTGFFFAVVLAVVSFAGSGLWLNRLLSGVRLSAAATIIGAANGAAFLIVAGTEGSLRASTGAAVAIELPRALIFDVPLVLLTVWLLRETDATRVSSRTLLGPASTIIEGYLMMRAEPPRLTVLAAAMLIAASLWLMRAHREAVPATLLQL